MSEKSDSLVEALGSLVQDRSGRRRLRDEIQSTWSVYEAREPGRPFRSKDLADADERSALDEPSHPGAPTPATRTTGNQSDGTLRGRKRALHRFAGELPR